MNYRHSETSGSLYFTGSTPKWITSSALSHDNEARMAGQAASPTASAREFLRETFEELQ